LTNPRGFGPALQGNSMNTDTKLAFNIEGDELARRMVERLNKYPNSLRQMQVDHKKLTARHMLAMALTLELEMKKNELLYLQAITLLAKAAVEEKKDLAAPRVPLTDTQLRLDTDRCVQLWYVCGDNSLSIYPTKMAAEIAARAAFPDEDELTRYARIFFKRFVQEP
jgi:hypothetical protein